MMRQAVNFRNIEVVCEEIAAALRTMSLAERMHLVADANNTARYMAAAGVRYRFPDWSNEQIDRQVARRMLSAAD